MIINIKKVNRIFFTKILVISFFILANLFITSRAEAAVIRLNSTRATYHQQEQFFVDILLDPNKEEDVNAFEISLRYPSSVNFIGSEDGSSIAGPWIEKPNARLGKVYFSGIIPGGFSGLIDPMSSDPLASKMPGVLARLIFVGNKQGDAIFDLIDQDVLANNGQGTILETSSNILSLKIDDQVLPFSVSTKDENPPQQFCPSVVKNALLFEDKYYLSFDTTDKETGIDHYEVKEDGYGWKIATSPYLLLNQPPTGTIYVKAVDKAGNNTVEQITPNITIPEVPIYSKMLAFLALAIAVLLLGFLILFTKKIIRKMQKKNK